MRTLLNIPLLALAALLATSQGCVTKSDSLYKTMAVTEATVDKAMTTWAVYVNWMTCQAGYDVAAFQVKQDRVKQAYMTYRKTMNSAYDARAAYATSQGAGATAWQSAVAAAQAAATELSKLVEIWTAPKTTPQ